MSNKLLIHAALTLAYLAGSWCFGAEPPTPNDDLVVIYNAGAPRFGHASQGWEKFFKDAEQHDFIVLHNPGGHYMIPMQLAQLSRARSVYPNELWTDYKAFARYGRKRDKWWGVYLGSPETFLLREGETDWQWRSRITNELRPIIDAQPDVLFFDAFTEIDQTRYRFLIERLRDTYKIQLGLEPCTYEDQPEMHDWAIAIQTEYINNREGPGSTSGWDTGKNAKRPLRYPGKHPLVIELVRSSYVKQDVAAARERGFVPGVNVGKIKELAK